MEPPVQKMVIYGVSFDMVGKQPIVLLKTADGNRFLPIWIGHPEAAAILMRLQAKETPRPMTHDLFTDVLGTIGAEIVQIAVTDLRDNTFYARITLRSDGSTYEIDSRPSDAIALAVRCDAPIFAADDVIEASAIQMEDEGGGAAVEGSGDVETEIQGFREFLENVRPEDFGGPSSS
jgi:bifunctional DNase/RNase